VASSGGPRPVLPARSVSSTDDSTFPEEMQLALREGVRRSAHNVVPLVVELLQPRSVVDVGCGLGTWLAVFREHGVDDILGIDGDYVKRNLLEIPASRFLAHDLREPLESDRRFDLVLALEVAEHLPEGCADTFVDSLTRLGELILFSAAVPHQGGINHLNEQWPSYWAERFGKRGYVHVDCLRWHLWSDAEVAWWYAQNTLLYATPEELARRPGLAERYPRAGTTPIALVHPVRYLELVEWALALREELHRSVHGVADDDAQAPS
jgi:SAM-dependent methyltransferase